MGLFLDPFVMGGSRGAMERDHPGPPGGDGHRQGPALGLRSRIRHIIHR